MVHIFCHTLDTIPMNSYLETELRHGTTKLWDILRIDFLLTFNFEDGFECIGEAFQEAKTVRFRTSNESIEWAPSDWSIQPQHVLECYNVIVEEEEEEPPNITIPKTEG